MPEVPEDAKPALDMLRSIGGEEMLAMMMQTFLQFADERLSKLVDESREGHIDEVAGIAHSLKSSARQLGAHAMGEACAVTEAAAKAGDLDVATNGVDAVEREYAAARPWMEAIATGSS
ncbi:MAG TPA: Hpt domain-containing protein [Gemmatimonadaceae bacterium]|nr:Hpt domain-containing protein [Gemmatimonadaceae bacterium]